MIRESYRLYTLNTKNPLSFEEWKTDKAIPKKTKVECYMGDIIISQEYYIVKPCIDTKTGESWEEFEIRKNQWYANTIVHGYRHMYKHGKYFWFNVLATRLTERFIPFVPKNFSKTFDGTNILEYLEIFIREFYKFLEAESESAQIQEWKRIDRGLYVPPKQKVRKNPYEAKPENIKGE